MKIPLISLSFFFKSSSLFSFLSAHMLISLSSYRSRPRSLPPILPQARPGLLQSQACRRGHRRSARRARGRARGRCRALVPPILPQTRPSLLQSQAFRRPAPGGSRGCTQGNLDFPSSFRVFRYSNLFPSVRPSVGLALTLTLYTGFSQFGW